MIRTDDYENNENMFLDHVGESVLFMILNPMAHLKRALSIFIIPNFKVNEQYNCIVMFRKIAPDKWKHFFVGIVMGAILQAFLWFLIPDWHELSTGISFLLVLLISYGFELFSKFTGMGHYDFIDAVAGVAGGILGMGIVLLFQLNVV